MRYLIFIFPFLFFLSGAQAAETAWKSADYLQSRIITGTMNEDGNRSAALEIRMAPDWHIYWRMPGDSGLAPQLDWSSSENLDQVVIDWPTPERIEVMGLHSFGYKDTVTFPLTVAPKNTEHDVSLSLKAVIMICKDICVPQDLTLNLMIPAIANENADRHKGVIDSAKQKIPHDGPTPKLEIKSVVVGPDALVAQIWSQKGTDRMDLFVEATDEFYLTAPPEITADTEDPRNAIIRITKPEGIDNLANEIMGHTVTLTLKQDKYAIEQKFDL